MPRRARVSVPGIPWHIIQRGNNRSPCFYADKDYHKYLDTLGEQAKKFRCDIHAYVLMTNHVHLLLTPWEENSAALLMKHLGQRYVQYFNHRYGRSGTLWEGRYKSCLAQDDNYALTCYRYIELNPVRANMVTRPENYRWSSYCSNAFGHANHLITAHEQYLLLGKTLTQRQIAYRELFSTLMTADDLSAIRRATNGNYVLGNGRFQKEVEKTVKRRVTPGKNGRPRKHQAREVK